MDTMSENKQVSREDELFFQGMPFGHGITHPGWPDGSCCCNCTSWIPLTKHPWNEGEGKGNMSEIMGHVCLLEMKTITKATFFDPHLDHGFCELHDPNEEFAKVLCNRKLSKDFGI